ncbi:MAG TPA: MFS transporter, partial [Aggregatilineaceae bacterium]|nr:MFS transporter [Aggregatilineaceae bacterium]
MADPQLLTPAEQPQLLSQVDDIYLRKPMFRWLALLAAVLAWGFDGVEQGVYSIMTRQALREIMPAARPMVDEADAIGVQLKGLKAEGRTDEALAARASDLSKQIDRQVGPMFSWSLAMWMWGAATGGILFGRIGDRFGRVRGLILAVIAYASFTGISAFSTHWGFFLGCRFFGAVGLGGTWPLCVALVVETWPENRRAILAGAIGAAANVGYLIASMYSELMLIHGCTWRWVIGMGFFIGLLSLPIIFFVPEPTKWRVSRQKKERSSITDLFTREYRRATVVGSLLSMVGLLGTWGAFLWLPTHVDQLVEGTAFAMTAKATIAKWSAGGQILGGFMGGMIAMWLGHRKSFMLLCIMAYASVVTLFGFAGGYGMGLKLVAAFAGVWVTAFFGWLTKYLPEWYPTRIRAT